MVNDCPVGSEPPGWGLRLSKVERFVVADGQYFYVSCAFDSDGLTSPARDHLDSLKSGTWPNDDSPELPDETQVKLHRRIYAICEALANDGEILPRDACKPLRDGVWEIVVGNSRITFYDTTGFGEWTAKHAEYYEDWRQKKIWLIPQDFDEHVRLGHVFEKVSQRTLEHDLEQAVRIRREDVAHDKAA